MSAQQSQLNEAYGNDAHPLGEMGALEPWQLLPLHVSREQGLIFRRSVRGPAKLATVCLELAETYRSFEVLVHAIDPRFVTAWQPRTEDNVKDWKLFDGQPEPPKANR